MDSINLKDFRPDNPDFGADKTRFSDTDAEIPASGYHQEINTLKIDKLSNRVTIISIILPCLIGAILVFAYLDMKERVVDVDVTKQSQVDRISQQLEEKLNALDVKIAKNRYDLDNSLPELSKKTVSIEGQIAKLTDTKADNQHIEQNFAKLEKRVTNNAKQDKVTIQTIERINKATLSSIKKNQDQFDKTVVKIQQETTLFKEEFDARLLELSDYEQQIGELRKDLSLLDKRYRRLEQESPTKAFVDRSITELTADIEARAQNLNTQLGTLNQKFTTNILRLQKDIERLSAAARPSAVTNKTPGAIKPKPQINIDSADIQEESLTQ